MNYDIDLCKPSNFRVRPSVHFRSHELRVSRQAFKHLNSMYYSGFHPTLLEDSPEFDSSYPVYFSRYLEF